MPSHRSLEWPTKDRMLVPAQRQHAERTGYHPSGCSTCINSQDERIHVMAPITITSSDSLEDSGYHSWNWALQGQKYWSPKGGTLLLGYTAKVLLNYMPLSPKYFVRMSRDQQARKAVILLAEVTGFGQQEVAVGVENGRTCAEHRWPISCLLVFPCSTATVNSYVYPPQPDKGAINNGWTPQEWRFGSQD